MIFLQIAILILGFVFLVKGADFFVDGSSAIARLFNIPSLVIGLTIVAFGTSLPELSVSLTSAIKGSQGIAFGNVVGSNIVNLMLVTGIATTVRPMTLESSLLKKDFPFSILITIALLILLSDSFFTKSDFNVISRADGLILLLFFIIFMYSTVQSTFDSKNNDNKQHEQTELHENESALKSILTTIVGLAGVILGGQAVVKSATYIAEEAGFSQTLIGLTIVAFGTSLPELVTSIIASRKGENDIAMGNVIGSNIFNILFILGLSTSIMPIQVESYCTIDCLILIGCSFIVYFMALPKLKLTRISGLIMTAIYIAYDFYIFFR